MIFLCIVFIISQWNIVAAIEDTGAVISDSHIRNQVLKSANLIREGSNIAIL